MQFHVMLRDGSSGLCRIGHVDTEAHAPPTTRAHVLDKDDPVAPNNGLIVICPPGVQRSALLDLIAAGYAVQVRDVQWRPSPATSSEDQVEDPEAIDLP